MVPTIKIYQYIKNISNHSMYTWHLYILQILVTFGVSKSYLSQFKHDYLLSKFHIFISLIVSNSYLHLNYARWTVGWVPPWKDEFCQRKYFWTNIYHQIYCFTNWTNSPSSDPFFNSNDSSLTYQDAFVELAFQGELLGRGHCSLVASLNMVFLCLHVGILKF